MLFASGIPRGSGAVVAYAFRCPAPEPTRFNERQAGMNAVERLLAHGEQIVSLFDEMLGEYPDVSEQTYSIVRVEQDRNQLGECFGEPGFHFSAKPAKATLTAERLALMERVPSHSLMDNAICKAYADGARSRSDLPSQVVETYCGWLERIEQLLHSPTMHSLLAGVVAESLSWGPHAANIASLARDVNVAVRRLCGKRESVIRKPFFISGAVTTRADWLIEKRRYVRPAIDALHPYARPPAPLIEAAEKKANSSRSRGGRRQNNEALARDLLAGWDAFNPEDVRPKKPDYIARRPEVMAMKSLDARQKKAALLLTALNSALALRRSKARQMRPPRG